MQYHQRSGIVSFVCGVLVVRKSNGLRTEPRGTPTRNDLRRLELHGQLESQRANMSFWWVDLAEIFYT